MTFLVERPQPGFKAAEYSRQRDAWRSDRVALLDALPIELEVWPEPRNLGQDTSLPLLELVNIR